MSSAARTGAAKTTSATLAAARHQPRPVAFVIFKKKDKDISTAAPRRKKANLTATLRERDDWVNFARAFERSARPS